MRVAIAGGGVAGWMAAAALARRAEVVVIEPPALPAEPALTTLPRIKRFHGMLGIAEVGLLARCRGTFRLGTRFAGWGRDGGDYFCGFGEFGWALDGVPLDQLWFRLGAARPTSRLADLHLPTLAAERSRFARPTSDRAASFDYGYHLDAGRYAAVMRELAEANGATRLVGELARVEPDPGGRGLGGLVSADGRVVTADLYIDATPGSTLIGALGSRPVDWPGWSANVLSREQVQGALPPFTAAIAGQEGWERLVPLQGSTERLVIRAATGHDAAGPLGRGAARRLWVGNCVALGPAAAAVEPTDLSVADWAQSGIEALLDPSSRHPGAYETRMAGEADAIRDLNALHHWTGEGTTGPERSPSLVRRIERFRACGTLEAGEPFPRSAWLAALIGKGIEPRSWDPRADAIDADRAVAVIRRLAVLLRQSADTMPVHEAFVARHCRGEP